VLREGDQARLEVLIRSSSVRAGLALRARIVLLATEGLPYAEIARRCGGSRPTVVDWRARYDAGGIGALHDQRRSGRPPEIDEIDVNNAPSGVTVGCSAATTPRPDRRRRPGSVRARTGRPR